VLIAVAPGLALLLSGRLASAGIARVIIELVV
jgi:hypothetical protein